MKRILLVLTVALMMAAMMLVIAAPAFAKGEARYNACLPTYLHGQHTPWFCIE